MRRKLVRTAAIAALPALACVPPADVGAGTHGPVAIRTGDQLLAAMSNRYAGRWYGSMTFVQRSTYYRADGSILRAENWYEAMVLPGRLRIDIGEPSAGTGVVYRGDSIYEFRSGRLANRRLETNPLLTLGFDVYAQPASRTADQLRRINFTLTTLRRDTLDGRPVYVVGAAKGDSTTNQFWVDAERLLFVRAIQTVNGQTRDMRFERYTQYDGGWVAEEVRILNQGRLAFLEQYSQVRVNVELDENLFVPEQFRTAPHWHRP